MRETYKFRYSTYQENPGASRSLLSRIDDGPGMESPSPVRGRILLDEKDERTLGEPSAEEQRLCSRQNQQRLRSASFTLYSLASPGKGKGKGLWISFRGHPSFLATTFHLLQYKGAGRYRRWRVIIGGGATARGRRNIPGSADS